MPIIYRSRTLLRPLVLLSKRKNTTTITTVQNFKLFAEFAFKNKNFFEDEIKNQKEAFSVSFPLPPPPLFDPSLPSNDLFLDTPTPFSDISSDPSSSLNSLTTISDATISSLLPTSPPSILALLPTSPYPKFNEQSLKMIAMTLPDNITWPSFSEPIKQNSEILKQVYFHRYGQFDSLRYQQTLEVLKGNGPSYVSWFGVPGIGKCKSILFFSLNYNYFSIFFTTLLASAVNYILFQLLANLGSPNFPQKVYYRVPLEGIFIFSHTTGGGGGGIEVKYNNMLDLKTTSSFSF